MKQVFGDLIKLSEKGKFDLIAHGCNCFCSMNAGIALQISTIFPEALEADLKTGVGDKAKLGHCSAGEVIRENITFTVLNCYIQYHYEGVNVLVDYDALTLCMKKLKKEFAGKRIGLPKIGAGLAGGDWRKISSVIRKELSGEDVTLVIRG